MKKHTSLKASRPRALSFPPGLPLLLLQAFLITAAAVLPPLRRLGLSLPPAFLLAAFVAPPLVYAALSPFPRLRFLLYPLALFSVLAAAYSAWPDFLALLSGSAALPELPAALAPLLRPLVFILSVLVSVTALSVGEISCFPLGVAVACFAALLSAPSGPMGMLLPGLALAVSACPSGRGAHRALPAALLSFLAAALLASGPLASFESPTLRERAEEILQGARDRLFYTEARMPFSLSALGWQPLGADRLGGSVSPSNAPLLEVRASSPLLLRGTVHSEYDGHAFSDPTPGRRYLLTDPRYRRLRDELFGRNLPKGALRAALPLEESVAVRLLADAAGTLFVTGRFDGLSGDGLVLYHSGTGEIFATRNLSEGDVYVFRGVPLSGGDPVIRSLAEAAERQADAAPDLSAFLALPESVEPEVFRLAGSATAGAGSAAEKAERLVSWLSASCAYSLQQNAPPEDREFVSWFLLSERRGSCTSFAAALVVLARCAGLPARYCEGFSAHPGPDGAAVLTGWDAHAWSEIYLPGLGWTPFDATPADRTREGNPPSSGADRSQAGDAPSPDPDGGGRSARLQPGAPQDAGAPAPTAPDTDSGSFGDAIRPLLAGILPRVPALVLLSASLFLLLFAASLFFRSPGRRAKGAAPLRAVRVWYAACQALLSAHGLPPLPSEAPGSYLRRADAALPGLGLNDLADIVNRTFYARHRTEPGDTEAARRVYTALRKRLPFRERLKAALLPPGRVKPGRSKKRRNA